MPLDARKVASDVATVYSEIIENDYDDTLLKMAEAWENAIHSDAMKGQVTIAQPSPSAASHIIRQAVLACNNNSNEIAGILAKMFSDYWATSHLTPKAPAVKIIGNDAATKINAYKAEIEKAITRTEKEPYFFHFFKAVENVTKTIVWTGVTSAGSPVVGNIS